MDAAEDHKIKLFALLMSCELARCGALGDFCRDWLGASSLAKDPIKKYMVAARKLHQQAVFNQVFSVELNATMEQALADMLRLVLAQPLTDWQLKQFMKTRCHLDYLREQRDRLLEDQRIYVE